VNTFPHRDNIKGLHIDIHYWDSLSRREGSFMVKSITNPARMKGQSGADVSFKLAWAYGQKPRVLPAKLSVPLTKLSMLPIKLSVLSTKLSVPLTKLSMLPVKLSVLSTKLSVLPTKLRILSTKLILRYLIGTVGYPSFATISSTSMFFPISRSFTSSRHRMSLKVLYSLNHSRPNKLARRWCPRQWYMLLTIHR